MKSYIDELKKTLDYDFIAISADNDVNLDELKEKLFQKLDLIRIYMRPKGEKPDFEEPLIVRNEVVP